MSVDAKSTPTNSNYLQLDWSDENGIITVTPKNESRFAIKVRRAVELLQLGDKIDEFTQQFRVLLTVLAEWAKDRSDIQDAYITTRDGSLAFVVVRNTARYDEEFEDALSDLDIAIANDADLNLIRLVTMALPLVSDGALASFLDPAFTLHYLHGDRS